LLGSFWDESADLGDKFFRRIDANADGEVDTTEFAKAADAAASAQDDEEPPTVEMLAELFDLVDADASGTWSRQETDLLLQLASRHSAEAAEETEGGPATETLSDAFSEFDENGDGKLDREELRQLVIEATAGPWSGDDIHPDEVEALLAAGDLDGDGALSVDETESLLAAGADADGDGVLDAEEAQKLAGTTSGMGEPDKKFRVRENEFLDVAHGNVDESGRVYEFDYRV